MWFCRRHILGQIVIRFFFASLEHLYKVLLKLIVRIWTYFNHPCKAESVPAHVQLNTCTNAFCNEFSYHSY